MQIQWNFESADEFLRATLPRSWDVEQPEIERLLAPFQPRTRTLRIVVDGGSEPGRVEIRALIRLPTGVLVAEAGGTEPQRALQQVAEEIRKEARAHAERLESGGAGGAKGRRDQRRSELRAALPLLERDVAKGRRDRFFQLLWPVLASIRSVARHELRILEIERELPCGDLTADDLIDEAVTIAWDRFGSRPPQQDLDAWLVEIVHEVLSRWRREPSPVSLARDPEAIRGLAPPEPPGGSSEGDDHDDQRRFELQPDDGETRRLLDRLRDERGAEPWEEIDLDERATRLLGILSELPAIERQAWLLSAVEGYGPDEIASIQTRSPADVERDLLSTEDRVRSRYCEIEALAEREEISEPEGSAEPQR